LLTYHELDRAFIASIPSYKNKVLKSIEVGGSDLKFEDETGETEKLSESQKTEVMNYFKELMGENVSEVKVSKEKRF
jgi:HSP90 family molecular chaperone